MTAPTQQYNNTCKAIMVLCRVADRLVLEPLMQEALQRLLAHPVSAASAPPLLRLASSLPGRQDVAAIGERAEKVLLQQVCVCGRGCSRRSHSQQQGQGDPYSRRSDGRCGRWPAATVRTPALRLWRR